MRLAVVSIVLLIILVSVQVLLPPDMFFGGTVDFALIIVVYVALTSGGVSSLFFAFLSGILVDSFSSHFFGSTALAYLIIVYIISLFHKKIYFDNILSMVFIPFVATLGKTIIVLIIILVQKYLILSSVNIELNDYLLSMLFELLLNVAFSPLVYFLMNKITGTKKRTY